MNAASAVAAHTFRPQLLERRSRLQAAAGSVPDDYFAGLIAEIDAALARIEHGQFGICESCHDSIEQDRLAHNPLIRFCLDHLSQAELRAHQQDLDLATQIQSKLLPPRDLALDHWETQYRYQPVGAVGGDYCELIILGDGKSLFFAVGDVAGKGVAASLLMTHLSAIFRSLLSLDLSLADLVARANRLFCESTAPAHYATLVCGRATPLGIELCSAGHCPPLVVRRDATERLDSTGLPLGLFCGGQYAVRNINLDDGESLVLYSDGITEAQDPAGDDYQEERLIRALRDRVDQSSGTMADGVLQDVARFRQTRPPVDDMTLLIVRRRR
uniref:Serine phosphatase n=1 Tax=Solibacter usitatus (strain Ellin6076) TaxID=234267 RepID=Q020R1_SOLUE